LNARRNHVLMCVFGAIRGLYRECTVNDRFRHDFNGRHSVDVSAWTPLATVGLGRAPRAHPSSSCRYATHPATPLRWSIHPARQTVNA